MATSNSGDGSQSMATSSSDLQQSILASNVEEWKYWAEKDHLGFLKLYWQRPHTTSKEDNPNQTSTRFVVKKFGDQPPYVSSVQVPQSEDLSVSIYGNRATNQESRPRTVVKVQNPVFSHPEEISGCPKCVSLAKGTSYLINLLGDGIAESQADEVFELMIDEYGHHTFTQILEHFNEAALTSILTMTNDFLFSASLYEYGTRSVLKLIEVCQYKPFSIELTKAFGRRIYALLVHENGRHVVLKCLTLLTSKQNDAIYVALMKEVRSLGRHEIGCISLCECIDALKSPQSDSLLNSVIEASEYFSYSPFGIHVLNHVMKLEHPGVASEICSRLRPCISQLSRMREGSEFLQACLRSDGRRHVIEGLVATNCLIDIAQDTYGLQLILNALSQNVDETRHLEEALQPHLEILKFHPGFITSMIPLETSGKSCLFYFPENTNIPGDYNGVCI